MGSIEDIMNDVDRERDSSAVFQKNKDRTATFNFDEDDIAKLDLGDIGKKSSERTSSI